MCSSNRLGVPWVERLLQILRVGLWTAVILVLTIYISIVVELLAGIEVRVLVVMLLQGD